MRFRVHKNLGSLVSTKKRGRLECYRLYVDKFWTKIVGIFLFKSKVTTRKHHQLYFLKMSTFSLNFCFVFGESCADRGYRVERTQTTWFKAATVSCSLAYAHASNIVAPKLYCVRRTLWIKTKFIHKNVFTLVGRLDFHTYVNVDYNGNHKTAEDG